MLTMNISLSPQLAQLIEDKVESGLFNNASEVISEALRNFDTQQELDDELMLLRFGEALAPGIEQAHRNEFSNFTFDEIIAKADRESFD